MHRVVLIAILTSAFLTAQGTAPRASADKYVAHGVVGDLKLGAEYLVRSMPTPDGMINTANYLVVEVAAFGTRANLAASYFSLRINGSKTPILAQQPFVVANALSGPQSASDGAPQGAVIGIGGIGATIGRPVDRPTQVPPVQDPLGRTPRTPRPVETPNPHIPDRPVPLSIREQVELAALPSSDVALPVAGALFFAYRGKPESIKSVELIYEGPAGMLTLNVRP